MYSTRRSRESHDPKQDRFARARKAYSWPSRGPGARTRGRKGLHGDHAADRSVPGSRERTHDRGNRGTRAHTHREPVRHDQRRPRQGCRRTDRDRAHVPKVSLESALRTGKLLMSSHKEHTSPPEWAPPAPRPTSNTDIHEPDQRTADHSHGNAHDDEAHDHALEWPEMLRISLVALAAAAGWGRMGEPLPAIRPIGGAGF